MSDSTKPAYYALLELGPAVLCQRIASEFWSASRSSEFREDVVRIYHQARHLMGILEIIEFNSDVAIRLVPFYRLCAFQRLFKDSKLTPSYVKQFATAAAKAFDRAAQELAHA